MYSALKIIIKNIKALKNKYFGVKYYPSDIILEVTNRCNLACEYCPAHGKNSERYRKEGDMDKAVWKKIINDAGKWKRRVNIQIAGFGEPLLYKNINELILYAKERNNIRIGLFTNGMLLSDNIIENMVKNKMDWICFSLGGLDSKINDSMRVGSKLETIECNIFKLIEEKKRQLSDKPEIMINIAAPRLDIIQKEEYLDKWLPNVSKITVPGIRDFNKSYKEECDHLRKTIDWSGCYFLYNWFVVNYDGSVSICCEDYNGKIIL